MRTKNIILVTGSNRSGSTWVGRVLAANGKVDNIIEPLNPNRVKQFGKFDLNLWYPNVSIQGSPKLEESVHKIIAFYVETSIFDPFFNFFNSNEGHSLIKSFNKRARRATKPVKLLKDPTALFCVPFLVDHFSVKPVILIRHPAAYVLSIIEKDWWFDFNNLLTQEQYFLGKLAPLKAEVLVYQANKENKSIVDNASLLWKIFYTQVLEYRQQYPDWFYVTHESLSLQPMVEFKKMFDYLELDFTPKVQNYIIKSTTARQGSEFVRDSKSNALKWQEKLSVTQKQTIHSITWGIAKEFYTAWE